MNPKEHIKHIHFILRRVSHQQLEKEFKESLDMASETFFNAYKNGKDIMSITRFTNLTISITLDGIHHELYTVMPEDSEWYVHTHNALNEYYQDRIKLRYKELQELISNIIE
jgi:hypothetical protein